MAADLKGKKKAPSTTDSDYTLLDPNDGGTGAKDKFDYSVVESERSDPHLKAVGQRLAQIAEKLGALEASVQPDKLLETMKRLVQAEIAPLQQTLAYLSQEVKTLHTEQSAANAAHSARAEASDSIPALLQEEFRKLEESLRARQEEWLDRLPGQIQEIARVFLESRATFLNDLVQGLPELFDILHDKWSFWNKNDSLTPDELAARPYVLPVLDDLESEFANWRAGLGVHLEDPMTKGPAGTVTFDDRKHERDRGEFTDKEELDQTIKNVLFVGYRWRDEWLRKPKVIVLTLPKKPRSDGTGTATVTSAEGRSQAEISPMEKAPDHESPR